MRCCNFKFSMSNGCDASILVPIELTGKIEIKDESKDSGINSSNSMNKGCDLNIIIPFRALNKSLDDEGALNDAVLQSSVIVENKLAVGVPECSTIQGSENADRDISRGK